MEVNQFNGYHKTDRKLLMRLASDEDIHESSLRVMLLALASELMPGDEIELRNTSGSAAIHMPIRTFERARNILIKKGYLIPCGVGQRNAKRMKISVSSPPNTVMGDGIHDGKDDANTIMGDGTNTIMGDGSAGVIHYIGNYETMQIENAKVKSLSEPPKKPKKGKKKTGKKVDVVWTGEILIVPDVLMKKYRTKFPRLDIPSILIDAERWLLKNPAKASGYKSFDSFLNNWLHGEEEKRQKRDRDDSSYELTGDSLAKAQECANLFGRAVNE